MVSESEATVRTTHGEGTVRVVSPQLLTTVVRGVAELGMVLQYFRVFHAFIDAATHQVDVFHDWYDVTGADAEARAVYTRWVKERKERHRRICRGVHILVNSPFVYLALEAGMIGVSYGHAHRVRATFARAQQEAAVRPSSELIVR